MKKVFITVVLVLSVAVLFTSCKDEHKKTEDTSATEVVAEKPEAKELAAVVYQCPMDCEHGKTYDKPGKCPVCKMEIKKVKATSATEKKEVDEHAGHNHD